MGSSRVKLAAAGASTYVARSHRTEPRPPEALTIRRALRLIASPYTVYSARARLPTQAHSSCPVVTPTHAVCARRCDRQNCQCDRQSCSAAFCFLAGSCSTGNAGPRTADSEIWEPESTWVHSSCPVLAPTHGTAGAARAPLPAAAQCSTMASRLAVQGLRVQDAGFRAISTERCAHPLGGGSVVLHNCQGGLQAPRWALLWRLVGQPKGAHRQEALLVAAHLQPRGPVKTARRATQLCGAAQRRTQPS